MSSRIEYSIHCDEPGCAASFRCGLARAWDTRDAAKRDGWTIVVPPRDKLAGPAKSLDLCPTHSEAA